MKGHPWRSYSKKLLDKLDRPRCVGFFTAREAEEKEMRLVTGRGRGFCLYWLVDESDGIVADARFQAFGPPLCIAVLEIVAELSLRKTYDQASRFSEELIDRHVRDKKEGRALPLEAEPWVREVLFALQKAVHQCLDIPFAVAYESTPIQKSEQGEMLAGWDTFPVETQQRLIAELLDREVRPYVELDAGSVEVTEVKGGREVGILFRGACTSCPSSQGSTLSAIQEILRAKVHPEMRVFAVYATS